MPRPTKSKQAIIAELTNVFRRNGFHGATLSKLTEQTGLERASLYHHFPGGKQDMAEQVLRAVLDDLGARVLATLETDCPPKQRLANMLDAVDAFYEGGRSLCFISVFAIDEDNPALAKALGDAVFMWAERLQSVIDQAGSGQTAWGASSALAMIQGGLILSGITKDPSIFARAIDALRVAWCLQKCELATDRAQSNR